MTTLLLSIVSHTPLWVWAVFAALVAYGLKQTRTQDIGATRVWLAPALVGAGSLWSLLSAFAPQGAALPLAGWLVGAALGALGNRTLVLPRQVRANADGSFRVEGSVAPLLLLAGVFTLRYVTGVVLAIHPALASDAVAALVVGLGYGLTAGLLAARSRKVWASRGALPAPLAA
jgi:hypothetical protein